jgi:hypothetical protein
MLNQELNDASNTAKRCKGYGNNGNPIPDAHAFFFPFAPDKPAATTAERMDL